MPDNQKIFSMGLVAEKETKLKEIKVRISSHKESFDFEYVKNKLHPERHNIADLRVLVSNLLQEIDAYIETHQEVESLKGN